MWEYLDDFSIFVIHYYFSYLGDVRHLYMVSSGEDGLVQVMGLKSTSLEPKDLNILHLIMLIVLRNLLLMEYK